MLSTNFKKQSGYTIIETMIAVSLFIIVVNAGMGALLNANLLHNKSQNLRSIMDSLSFAMEDISRSLRTGSSYQCFMSGQALSFAALGGARSCASGWAVAFEAAEGNKASYNDQVVYYVSNDGKIFKSTDGANNFFQMTPNEIIINVVSNFSILGAEPLSLGNNRQQPLVTIKLVGTINYKNVSTPFSIETSVSQRLVDI